MFELPPQHLVRLRTRPETLYVSQNRTVLATRRDGFINAEPHHGFFVQSTRLLSRYEYRLNGKALFANGLSNVEQHTWLGYYVAPAPDAIDNYGTQGPGGATAQQTIEMRLSRFVSDGLHEDVDVTNFTQRPASLTLDLILDADFADTAELEHARTGSRPHVLVRGGIHVLTSRQRRHRSLAEGRDSPLPERQLAANPQEGKDSIRV
jgi:hypothetical protein